MGDCGVVPDGRSTDRSKPSSLNATDFARERVGDQRGVSRTGAAAHPTSTGNSPT